MVENVSLQGNAAVLLVSQARLVNRVCASDKLLNKLSYHSFACHKMLLISLQWILSIAVCALRCLNGGQCVTPGICRCMPGYFGTRCQEGEGYTKFIARHPSLVSLDLPLTVTLPHPRRKCV